MAHPGRQAVCRCPRCRRFFCRECVTEHVGQFVCSVCLQQMTSVDGAGRESKRKLLGSVLLPFAGLTSIALAWLFFYLVGSLLVTLSTSAAVSSR